MSLVPKIVSLEEEHSFFFWIKNQRNRKILISLCLTIEMISATVVTIALLQRPQTYLSKAASPEIILKNASGEILPIAEDGLPTSNTSKITVELQPKITPQFYKVGQTPLELEHAEAKRYENPPVTFLHELKHSNNLSPFFVEFIYSDGTSKKINSLIRTSYSFPGSSSLDQFTEFVSPRGGYTISFDQRQWHHEVKDDKKYGSRVVFDLNKEYGTARLEIVESNTHKDIDGLKNELVGESPFSLVAVEAVQFQGRPSYTLRYKETILGLDVYRYQQVVKVQNNFFVFEIKAPQLGYDKIILENLLQNISLLPHGTDVVKGISDSPTDLTKTQIVDIVRPSIASIVYRYCLKIANLQPHLSGLSKPEYNFCTATKGSGFIVNEDGIVATNGHVVKIYPEEGLVTNFLYAGNMGFSTDVIRGIYISKGRNPTKKQIEDFYEEIHANPHYVDRFLTEIFRLIKDNVIDITLLNEKYYMNVGEIPTKVDYKRLSQGDYMDAIVPSRTTYFAKLLDVNYPNKYSYNAIINKQYTRGLDVALLQIENPSYHRIPALELGSIDNITEGAEILIAGYPTLVEGEEDPRSAISYKTSTKPTISRGIVSAIKEDLSGRTILQTDASIDHGNSGGPAVNSLGQVIGIATFMTESKSGNFNFLRDVNELKKLMSKNKIENKLAQLSTSWRNGLEKFRKRHFKEALIYFKEVETLSPSHPSVKEFIERSEIAIANGESLEGLAGILKGAGLSSLVVVFSGILIISLLFTGFLLILPLFEKMNAGILIKS